MPIWDQQTYDNYLARRAAETNRVASGAEPERCVVNEPVAASKDESCNPIRRHVLVESYRFRLIDSDNLCAKFFVDALVKAGILFDDSEKFCQIEVRQIKVNDRRCERTEITVTEI
jgi:hypothetical protein